MSRNGWLFRDNDHISLSKITVVFIYIHIVLLKHWLKYLYLSDISFQCLAVEGWRGALLLNFHHYSTFRRSLHFFMLCYLFIYLNAHILDRLPSLATQLFSNLLWCLLFKSTWGFNILFFIILLDLNIMGLVLRGL